MQKSNLEVGRSSTCTKELSAWATLLEMAIHRLCATHLALSKFLNGKRVNVFQHGAFAKLPTQVLIYVFVWC